MFVKIFFNKKKRSATSQTASRPANKLADSLFFARHVVPSKKVLYLSPDKGAEDKNIFFMFFLTQIP
jgi:hypothetical protein